MNTKTLLIIFACLLVLLALLSAFGGSIRTTQQPFEGFYSPSAGPMWDGGVATEERAPMPPVPPMPPMQQGGAQNMPQPPPLPPLEQERSVVADRGETFIEPFENLETPSFGPY